MRGATGQRADAPHEIRENLRTFSNILSSCGVPFWLEAGTALAAHRDGKIFPWEHDVDVATWIDHKEGVLSAVSKMRARGWTVKIQKGFPYLDNIIQVTLPTLPDGREPFPNQYDIYLYRRVEDKAMMRWIHQPTGRFASLQKKMIWYAKALALPRGRKARSVKWIPQSLRRGVFALVLHLLVRFGQCKYHVHPLRFFQELRTMDFYGVTVQIPKDTDAFLAHRYGPGWKSPDPQFNQSGKWKKSNARPELPLRLLGMPRIEYGLQERRNERVELAQQLMQAGVRAGHPAAFMRDLVSRDGSTLTINGQQYPIENGVKMLAFGKAAGSMAEAFVEMVGAERISAGLVSAPRLDTSSLRQYAQIECIEGTHPFVSEQSLLAGQHALAFADACTESDVVVCLVSGGGSALLAHPAEGITLQQKIDFVRTCMQRGIAERELNVVRKGLSAIKGGKLARKMAPATIVNIILSDERSHQIEANASGPTVPNNTTLTAQAVLQEAGMWEETPRHLRDVLVRNPSLTDDDLADIHLATRLVPGRDHALAGMRKAAARLCDSVTVHEDFFHEKTHGSVEEVAQRLGTFFRKQFAHAGAGRHAVLAHGEVMVPAKKESRGGRCQHLAALMLNELRSIPAFTFAALSSDGCDFLHGVHGAVITDATIARVDRDRIDCADAVDQTATHALHERLGTLATGDYTGTNVNDYYIFIFDT